MSKIDVRSTLDRYNYFIVVIDKRIHFLEYVDEKFIINKQGMKTRALIFKSKIDFEDNEVEENLSNKDKEEVKIRYL